MHASAVCSTPSTCMLRQPRIRSSADRFVELEVANYSQISQPSCDGQVQGEPAKSRIMQTSVHGWRSSIVPQGVNLDSRLESDILCVPDFQ